jgi:predicted site-specific integrase-resolvase
MNNEDTQYISGNKISKKYGISVSCLRNWANHGKIKVIRPKDGKTKRYYSISDVNELIGRTEEFTEQKEIICYARVSSYHQKNDLDRQVQYLLQAVDEKTNFRKEDAIVIKDIASGVNFERKGLKTLLEKVSERKVRTVMVSYKDRLSRFGVELIQWFFDKYNTELLVLNKPIQDPEHINELAEDLLAISNHFVAKKNGAKAAKYRKEKQQRNQFIDSLQSISKEPRSSQIAFE